MSTLVQWVVRKDNKKRQLIKANRFNPEHHKPLKGKEGEPFPKSPVRGTTAAGLHVPAGTKQPVPAAKAEEVAVPPVEPAEEPGEDPKAPEEDPEDPEDGEAPKAPEAPADPMTAEELKDEKSRKELNEMADALGYPEEQVLDAPNKMAVAEMVVAGEYKPEA